MKNIIVTFVFIATLGFAFGQNSTPEYVVIVSNYNGDNFSLSHENINDLGNQTFEMYQNVKGTQIKVPIKEYKVKVPGQVPQIIKGDKLSAETLSQMTKTASGKYITFFDFIPDNGQEVEIEQVGNVVIQLK